MSPWLQTLLPVAAGFAVVLIGILVFKLHAFLALILAAGVTAVLTPAETILWHEGYKHRQQIDHFDKDGNGIGVIDGVPVYLKSSNSSWAGSGEFFRVPNAEPLHVLRRMPDQSLMTFGCMRLHYSGNTSGAGGRMLSGLIFETPALYHPQPGDLFVLGDDGYRAGAISEQPIPQRIATAFGDTVGDIGILIAFAAVIGMCLLDSGAADRIVRSALGLVGQRGAPVGFAGCGFLLGIPVFFDTVFFLMIPLGKAMRLRTGRNYILYVLTIYCGATMAHSLVPPTPGPLMVAESLGIEVGVMMLVGGCVGLVTASYGILHAWLVNRWIEIPLRDTPEMPLADLERLAAREDHELPPLWFSLLPILLPVWLIAQATALSLLEKNGMLLWGDVVAMAGWQKSIINALGEKNTALGIGVAVALFLLAWQTRASLRHIRDRVGMAIAAGGAIILITAAGGAFGDIIAQTGVASLIQDLPKLGTLGLLTLAFGVTVAIRTVQGSATVAMITAVGLFAGIETPFHPVWLALAIGCGSKPISWMTDSGFWVICKMSGMTEAETLKTLTPMTVMMGLVGLGTVLVGATLFPLR